MIIAVIGHIDHGKTSLVKAVSGIEGDTTPQEKQRGITIDVSFVHTKFEDKECTFIDVPGHEDLVKNMIAGAFSVDYALLVVSANESIKPQTIEHLQICKLLGIKNIIAAITKKDLADDLTLEKAKKDTTGLLENLKFNEVEVLPVSIFDANSINTLIKYLKNLQQNKRKEFNFFRYFIDRAFVIKGHGTVVTGTVLGGQISKKDKITICELGSEVEIKSIQVRNEKSDFAQAGDRAAINISNIDANDLQKGMQLRKKGVLRGFNTVDAMLEILNPNISLHDQEYILFLGSKKTNAKILELEKITDTKIFATIICDEPIFCVFKDKFILRNGFGTIGGGEILNPIADPLKKSQKIELLNYLQNDDFGKSFEFLTNVHKRGFGLISAPQRFNLTQDEAFRHIENAQKLFIDRQSCVIYPKQVIDFLKTQIHQIYNKNEYALLSAKSINERFKWASVVLCEQAMSELLNSGFLKLQNGLFIKADIKIDDTKKYVENRIYDILDKANFSPDAPYNIYDALDIDRKNGDDALKKLCQTRQVKRLAHNYFITTKHLESAIILMRDIIAKDGYIDIHNFKDKTSLTRKYLIALLEYLDSFSDINNKDGKRTTVKANLA